MRYLAVSDIHGCSRALQALAQCAAFTPDDVVITLGDYVNRGPDTRGVIDWLLQYRERGNLIALRGNHDIMLLEARDSELALKTLLEVGGQATFDSYAPPGMPGKLADIPDEHWQFLAATERYYEIDTHFFVHANAAPDLPLDEQPDFMLFWERFHHPPPHQSGKIMICGHTSQKSFRPVYLRHAICIDTRCYDGGWLTCLDVKSGRLWQANEQGQTQTGWIDD